MLETLARLNVTSRLVREETLPALYRRFEVPEGEEFAYVDPDEPPKGWTFVK